LLVDPWLPHGGGKFSWRQDMQHVYALPTSPFHQQYFPRTAIRNSISNLRLAGCNVCPLCCCSLRMTCNFCPELFVAVVVVLQSTTNWKSNKCCLDCLLLNNVSIFQHFLTYQFSRGVASIDI